MKKYFLFFAITICSITVSFAQLVQENLEINPSKSELKWTSDYTFYFGGHHGTVQFKEGHFIKIKDKITGGLFIIDMNTIANVDGGYNEGLVSHLKDPDFFDVKKHPTAKLVMTEVQYNDETHLFIKANLTILGITKPIKFKAEVDFEKSLMTTKFKVDRTRWGINYNSTVKDNAISDAIAFEVKLSL